MAIPRSAAVLLAAGFATAVLGARQTPPAGSSQSVFRARADLIELDVSVLDRDRKPVTGLTAADFTVLENGKPRPIVAFSEVNLPPAPPPEPGWRAEIPPDVVSNQVSAARIVVLVIDDASVRMGGSRTSGSWSARKVGETAQRLIDELDPADLAAVVFTRDNRAAQSLTLDRRRLRAAIARTRVAPGSSIDDADAEEGTLVDPSSQTGDCFCNLCSLESLRQVTAALQTIPNRRKTVIYISAGISMSPLSSCYADQVRIFTETMRRAQIGNVAIHPMDPTGLLTFSVTAASRGGPPLTRSTISQGMEMLRSIAYHTGTRAVVNNNDPDRQVSRILAESRSYYLLGFEPGDLTPDGKKRRLEVKVNRRGVDVRTRDGYFPPLPPRAPIEGPATARVERVIESLLPMADVPMQLSLTPFAAADGAEVAVVLGVQRKPTTGDAAGTEDVQVVARILDQYGRPRGIERRTVRLVITQGAADGRYQLLSRLPVAPGRYEIRLGVEARDEAGSVYGYVEVPDFTRAPLSSTGWLLSAHPSPATAPRELFDGLLPLVPTCQREFGRSDAVNAMLRIYQSGRSTAEPVSIETVVLDAESSTRFRDTRRIGADAFASGHADYTIDLPGSLPPGEYLLDARISSGSETLRSSVRYNVR